ncbi:hypothetical protein AB3H31_00325 [Escherichia coli]
MWKLNRVSSGCRSNTRIKFPFLRGATVRYWIRDVREANDSD